MASFGEIAKLLLERANDVPGGNAARYYLGPAYNPIESVVKAMPSMLPGADMVDMTDNSRRLLDYQGPMETLGDAGWLGLSALGMALPGRPGALREPVEGITAYHGSPHDFDRFDMGKIGTGEGAQAYGHGLYFAENEGVARSYRDALENRKYMPGDGPSPLKTAWSLVSGSKERAAMPTDELVPFVRNAWPDAADEEIVAAIEGAKAQIQPGKMYEVRINANPDDFLDWDKPLSEQSERVRAGLDEAGFAPPPGGELMPGSAIYERAMRDGDAGAWNSKREHVTSALRELGGIPGIRYLDQGSRAAGEGSRNYVVFDDNLVEILRKYGMAGLLAGATGTNALSGAVGDDGERF